MMASSSAMTTRVDPTPLPEHPVEQVVLGALQIGNLGQHLAAVTSHGVGVALGLTLVLPGERGLRHQRTQPGIVGDVVEHRQLLIGHGEILPKLGETGGDLAQPTFEERPGHDRRV